MTLSQDTDNRVGRELYRPSRDEIQAAVETLLRSPISREARAVVREIERTLA